MDRQDLTILYYTSNREDPEFEMKVLNNTIAQSGGLPVVSVSQKPITNFGENIVVGDVGNSYINEYRQILIGLDQVKTEYFASTESDFLYPRDYFEFKPSGEDIYRSDNVWIAFPTGGYRKKPYSEGAQIARTAFMKDFVHEYLKGLPEWFDGRPDASCTWFNRYLRHQKRLWRLPFTFFDTSPCLSFKTGRGVRPGTNTEGMAIPFLQPWGDINELRKIYEIK
jgi:hypothetical protein